MAARRQESDLQEVGRAERSRPVLRHLLRHLRIAGIVSLLYVWAYFTTMYFVPPAQEMIVSGGLMSLLFLPHGVRVLSAWLHGWRSVAYLLPGALLCNQHFAGERAWDPVIVAGTMISLVSAPLAIGLLRRLVPADALGVGTARVGGVLLVGAVASVLNMSGLWAVYGLAPLDAVITLLGDMAGLFAALLIMRAGFWLAER